MGMGHYEHHSQHGDWMPSLPPSTISYHTSSHLDHHHSHTHHATPVSHAHTYPSQHVSILNPDHALSAPMLSSPSYSQDRESHISEHDAADQVDPHTIPALPSYHLSHGSYTHHPHGYHAGVDAQQPPTPPLQASNTFKRPYSSTNSPQPPTVPQPHKRRKSSANKEAWTMTDDDTLLLQLKDDEGLPWKVIASRFRELQRGEFRVPTLQMRYKRLKERMRIWDADDVQYLKDAKDYVEKQKWELVSQRMVELGCKKKIPGSACEKKWKEVCPHYAPPTPGNGSASSTPALSGMEMKRSISQISGGDEDLLGEIREDDEEGGVGLDGLSNGVPPPPPSSAPSAPAMQRRISSQSSMGKRSP